MNFMLDYLIGKIEKHFLVGSNLLCYKKESWIFGLIEQRKNFYEGTKNIITKYICFSCNMKNWVVFLGSLCVRQWHIRTTPGLLESLPSSFEAYNCEKRGEQFSQVSKREKEKNRNTQTTQLVALINYDDCIFEFLTTPNKGIIIVYLHFPNEAKYCTSTKKGFLFLQGASASVKCKHSCLL